jgi:hypothetical protein
MRPLRRLLIAAALAAPLILLNGCVRVILEESREIARQMHEDQVDFYEHLATSYYLLGYEYFNLARDMKEQKKEEESQEMAYRAKVYYEHSEDLTASAKLLRIQYGIDSKEPKFEQDAEAEALPNLAADKPAP